MHNPLRTSETRLKEWSYFCSFGATKLSSFPTRIFTLILFRTYDRTSINRLPTKIWSRLLEAGLRSFQWGIIRNLKFLWFSFDKLCEWFKSLLQILSQSRAKPKLIWAWSPAFSRAWRRIREFENSFDRAFLYRYPYDVHNSRWTFFFYPDSTAVVFIKHAARRMFSKR